MALNDLSGEILRLEEHRIAAMRSKDCDALEGLLAEGLVYIHSIGNVEDKRGISIP